MIDAGQAIAAIVAGMGVAFAFGAWVILRRAMDEWDRDD